MNYESPSVAFSSLLHQSSVLEHSPHMYFKHVGNPFRQLHNYIIRFSTLVLRFLDRKDYEGTVFEHSGHSLSSHAHNS